MVGRTSYDFQDESAIVTGSTRGIGRGIATALADHDANVAVVSRTAEDVTETADELNELGDGRAVGITADVGDPNEIETLVSTTIDEFGTIDLLVNNAAVWPMEDNLVEASLMDWEHTIDVNVKSQYYTSQLVAQHMIHNDIEGNIINVTSQTGDRRTGGRGIYGISNTAINGLTWRMAHDLAEFGIRVNAVSTDVTETSQLRYEAGLKAENDPDRTTDDVLKEWGEARPIGRLGQPKDLANGVLFLASDTASYVVGTILRISGGGNLQ
jgi:NAD(P)-dependent dehydrogenase (short-subunit alcohol dehydrogenase family)